MIKEQAIACLDMFLYKQCDLERTKFAYDANTVWAAVKMAYDALNQIGQGKTISDCGDRYEYHYDHTDCIWYRPEARNRCPSTCAQYRDGWNDAMQYIFRDGKGYRPYRRGQNYETD